MRKTRRTGSALGRLALAAALIACLLLGTALAAAQPNGGAALTVSYAHEGAAIAGAKFRLYHVASGTVGAGFTLERAFAGYPVRTTGLTQQGWQELALTLAGYVQRDRLASIAEGTTNAQGSLAFTPSLAPGLYLLLGDDVNQSEYQYKATPAIIAMQGSALTAEPKHTRVMIPGPVNTITRRVLKIWNDVGCEHARPREIEVQLLRGGEVAETVRLNAANGWSHTWQSLDASAQWQVVEKSVPAGYSVKTELRGITYTITNTAEPCIVDPPVKKLITGDTPTVNATFRFAMEAVSNTAGYAVSEMPMPAGSVNGKKTKDIQGAQEFEFGEFMLMKPGVYVYKLYEENTQAAGYTYDTTVYDVIVEVTESNGKLSAVRTVKKGNQVVTEFTFPFTNPYEFTTIPPKDPQITKPPQLPQTGQVWWPAPVLALAGLALVAMGLMRGRRDER